MYIGQDKQAQAMAQGSGWIGSTGGALQGGDVYQRGPGLEQKREPELQAELTKMAKAVEFAHHSLNELHSRLDGKIMRPSMPEPISERAGIASVGPSTGYAQDICGYSMQVHSLGERIQDMLRRLEA